MLLGPPICRIELNFIAIEDRLLRRSFSSRDACVVLCGTLDAYDCDIGGAVGAGVSSSAMTPSEPDGDVRPRSKAFQVVACLFR